MKYTQFILFITQVQSQGIATLFLSGFTLTIIQKNNTWILKTKILIADRSECEMLLDKVPLREKLRMEQARTSLECNEGSITLFSEIPVTSRFLTARHTFENFLLLARFWKEELSPLTALMD